MLPLFLLSRCSTHFGRSSTQSPMWLRGGMWTLGDFSGSRGVMISTSTFPRIPFPISKTSSSTFSLSLLNELILVSPRVSTQNFYKSPLFKFPRATCCKPKMLKGLYSYTVKMKKSLLRIDETKSLSISYSFSQGDSSVACLRTSLFV